MRRYLLLLCAVTLSLFACSGEFLTCKTKLIDSHSIVNGQLQLSISKNERLVYSQKRPENAIKYDPFLGLALVKASNPFAYPFVFYAQKERSSAVVSEKEIVRGRISSPQCGLDQLGVFSQNVTAPAVVVERCCALLGIVTPNGIIENAYLQHFLQSEAPYYGDAGIELIEHANKIVVHRLNPYFTNHPLHVGDHIIGYDGKKFCNICDLKRAILFSKSHTLHRFSVEREGKLHNLSVMVQERMGGGLIAQSYLERSGIYLDKKLCIERKSEAMQKLQLQQGDCLKTVNYQTVQNRDDVKQFLRGGDQINTLLFERRNFQFFIHIKIK